MNPAHSLQSPNQCAILIPALNEENSIHRVVQEILSYRCGEVVVIADACTDDTAKIAKKAGATVIDLPIRLGAWGATQTGMRYALSKGYASAITMDADGQHNPNDMRRLLEPVHDDQADVCIGACIQRGSHARKIAWKYLRSISALSQQDITSGYRAYNSTAMKLLTKRNATLIDYQDVGVLLLLLQHDLHIVEVDVTMDVRTSGHSRIFHSWAAVAYYMYHTSVLSICKASHKKANR